MFLAQLNANSGGCTWARNMGYAIVDGGDFTNNGISIALDATGNIYTARNSATGSVRDITLTKSQNNGNTNDFWSKRIGGKVNSIAVDATNSLYATGYFSTSGDFNPIFAFQNFTNAYELYTDNDYNKNAFISKLEPINGNFVWAKSLGNKVAGTDDDMTGYEITVDASNNVLITGEFSGTADFDPNAGVTNLVTTTNPNYAQIFTAKYAQCAVQLRPITLANGILSTVYNQTLTQTGITGTPTYTITQGTLPGGLTLNTTTGIITGTPTALGLSRFMIQVTGGTCPQTMEYRIDVISNCPLGGTINGYTLGFLEVGTAVNVLFTPAGFAGVSVWSISAGALPPGLSINTTNGNITGIPTAGANNGISFNFTVQESNGVCLKRYVCDARIFCPPQYFAYGFTSSTGYISTPYTVDVSVLGASPRTYSISPALPTGLSLNTATGLISGTATSGSSQTYIITAALNISPGCTVTRSLTISIGCPSIAMPTTIFTAIVGAPYSQPIIQIGYNGVVTWAIIAGGLPSGLTLNPTTGVISGTPIVTWGLVNFTIKVTSGTCFDIKIYSAQTICPTLSFNSTAVANALLNTPYTIDASVTGNVTPVVYSVNPALPAGLSLNTTTGIISGTPTAIVGNIIYGVTATQTIGNCSRIQAYAFYVAACAFITTPILLNANEGSNYSQTLTQTGFTTFTWSVSIGTLPAGLTLAPTTGIISGIGTATGIYNFTIQITNGICIQSRAYSIEIVPQNFQSQQLRLSWAKKTDGTGDEISTSMTRDALGNVYTTGYFTGTVDFDPGVGVFNLTASGFSYYITKLDANGNFLWAKFFYSGYYLAITQIILDAQNNIHITGGFNNTFDCNPGVGVLNLVAADFKSDIFVIKLDTNGDFIWGKSFRTITGGSSYYDAGFTIAVDTQGNVYTTGRFSGTVDFDPGVGVFSFSFSFGGSFMSKLNAAGDFVWAKNLPYGVSSFLLDASNNIYVGGAFNSTRDFDLGSGFFELTALSVNDGFVSKLNPNGDFIWAKRIGGESASNISSMALDASNNIYTTGTFSGVADFDTSPTNEFNIASVSARDMFVSKLNATGDFVWAKAIGGTSNTNESNCIKLDIAGNVYTTGRFSGTADFDPNGSLFNVTSIGLKNMFLSKLDNAGNFIWVKSIETLSISASHANSLSIDATDNVYVSGGFEGTADFDPMPTVFNLYSRGGSTDAFVAKFTQCATVNITTNTLPNGISGINYNQTITQTGAIGTPTWSILAGNLPTGLSIVPTTGAITGMPTVAGTFSFTVFVNAGNCSQGKNYTVIISSNPNCAITFNNTTATNGLINTPYNLDASASAPAALTYSIMPALPAGLTLNTATGLISGTPTLISASVPYLVTASFVGGCIATKSYTFGIFSTNICGTIYMLPTSSILPTAYLNQPYTTRIEALGERVATYTFAKTSNTNLPAGFTLSETGVISGTPTTQEIITLDIIATSSLGCVSTSKSYVIAVAVAEDVTTSLDMLSNSVKVFPNPSKADFSIDFGTLNLSKSLMNVYNAQGIKVLSAEVNNNLMIVSLENFSNGIYLLEVNTPKGRILKRLIKQ